MSDEELRKEFEAILERLEKQEERISELEGLFEIQKSNNSGYTNTANYLQNQIAELKSMFLEKLENMAEYNLYLEMCYETMKSLLKESAKFLYQCSIDPEQDYGGFAQYILEKLSEGK